jgi:hypothetical protein
LGLVSADGSWVRVLLDDEKEMLCTACEVSEAYQEAVRKAYRLDTREMVLNRTRQDASVNC